MKFILFYSSLFVFFKNNLSSHLGGGAPRKLITNDQNDNIDEEIQVTDKITSVHHVQVTCNQEMLISYGLSGFPKSEIQNHRYCPNISENCCSDEDAKRSKYLWNNQFKFYLERYYETYLISLKYLLGFSAEAYLLATKYESSHHVNCKNAALDLISMNFNPTTTVNVYKSMSKQLRGISEIRQGFYCILCNAETQKQLSDFWFSTNRFNKDRIYMSKSFCHTLVTKSIKSAYYSIYYVKRFLDDLATLIDCSTSNSTIVSYEISVEKKTQIKNCYYFKNKYFFFFCEKYCENFHLTKASPLFDGDII